MLKERVIKLSSFCFIRPVCLGDVVEGLILDCVAYYGEKVTVKRESLGGSPSSTERFLLTQQIVETPKS